MRNSPSLALLLALMLLLHEPVTARNWQGTGEVSNEKLSFMWDYIQGNLQNAMAGGAQLKPFNEGFSAALNAAYDPAWNTVTALYFQDYPTNNDVVLYGYAFRNQWMWFNGYKRASISGNSFSFMVWKDYNCQAWKSLGAGVAKAAQQTGFNTQQKAVISQWISLLLANQLLNDPWGAAKSLIDTIQGSTDFVVNDDRAYSIIMQQQDYQNADLEARLCVVGQEYYHSTQFYQTLVTVPGGGYGRLILFRTR